MNRFAKACLMIVICAALFSCAILGARYLDLRNRLSATNDAIRESQETWQAVAEKKETLQEELTQLQSDLKEQNLSLTESEEKIVSLTEDIDQLNREILELKERIADKD